MQLTKLRLDLLGGTLDSVVDVVVTQSDPDMSTVQSSAVPPKLAVSSFTRTIPLRVYCHAL